MAKSDKCPHPLRSSQAINYFSGNKTCLLPLELMKCLDCKAQWILNSFRGEMVPHPTEGSKKLLGFFMQEAEKAKNGPAIIKPDNKIIA